MCTTEEVNRFYKYPFHTFYALQPYSSLFLLKIQLHMQTRTKAYLALAVVCVVWGTTYIALLIGVKTFPPFLFSGIRQTVAGVVLLIALFLFGKLKFTWSQFLHQSVPGILMISLGNGIIGWSERQIPSGLAALIVSILPVYIVLINFVFKIDRKKLNTDIIAGLAVGCVGIVLIFRDNLKDLVNPEYLFSMTACFVACLAWSFGSIYAKHKPSTGSVLTNAAIQMFSGGICLLVMSLFLDDYAELATVTKESIWALVYLIVFGSLITYTCFVYALDKLPVGVASLYAYVNPVIAIILGYLFLNEQLTWLTVAALTTVLGGVYFINRGFQKQ